MSLVKMVSTRSNYEIGQHYVTKYELGWYNVHMIRRRPANYLEGELAMPAVYKRCAGGREFDPRPGQYSRMSFSSDPGDWYGFLI